MKRAAPYTPLLVAAACVALLVPLQRWTDARGLSSEREEETLYFSRPESIKRMALGYDSLLADVYWMRTIQYFGRKVIDDPSVIEGRTDRLSLLYPLLDTATTLDPHEIAPYRFGGFFVHDYVDPQLGRALVEKGIRANPDYIPLYQDLAYLYWSDGDCTTASKVYAQAASIPGAPPWMAEVSTLILARCGRADLTAELLVRQYQSTDDPRIRARLADLLVPYRALAEVEYLSQAAAAYRERFGAPPSSLADLVRALGRQPGAPALTLRTDGTPVDPTGVPYVYDPATGAVSTAPNGVALPSLGPR